MESNLNHSYIRTYSKKLADKLIHGFFAKKQAVSGKELIEFSSIRQVNYFILHSLFESWKLEFNNLKSPYFNYDEAEVKEAAKVFMNVLSRHIRVEKENLKPLLEEAIAKTLILVFSPYDFYILAIRNSPAKKFETSGIKELARYIKINGHLLQAYIDELDTRQFGSTPVETAEEIFNEVCEQFRESPDEIDEYLAQFNGLMLLNVDDIYEHLETKSSAKQEDPKPSKATTDKKNQQILLDTFEIDRKEALVEIHQKKATEGIRKSLTINQRFMFEKELFTGNKEEFERVITLLDSLTSRKEALGYIADNYLKKTWDAEKDEVIEFLSILDKRFPE
ncbi:MAG: hypothetical protein U5K79_03735 [Cyclobacteriaceae bacterium]|nr:hypothetical protein [Cyclobacteriaceae bacterium]